MSTTNIFTSEFLLNVTHNCLSRIVQAFTDGGSLLKGVDGKTPEGLQTVFATNLFGHFLLVRTLSTGLCLNLLYIKKCFPGEMAGGFSLFTA